jgi:hypothetical protein
MLEEIDPHEQEADDETTSPDQEASLFDPSFFPFRRPVSGLYTWSMPIFRIPRPIPRLPERIPLPRPQPHADATADEASFIPWPFWSAREELRLDVDGRYPQMTASGTLIRGFTSRLHWIADLSASGINSWTGTIWYKNGDASALPHTNVKIHVNNSWFASHRKATVTFTGGGASARTLTFGWKSAYFHRVEFEFDTVENTSALTKINTGDHPNRPASLPNQTLSIETVYRRAGFQVSKSGDDDPIPLTGAGANETWSDAEMHDAMQVYWSRFADKAQWSMWVLFAAMHDRGSGLGGIMFDDIGPNHRQGTALFNKSFISNAPDGDPNPTAWVKRMKFWTAVHEMGHAFNLAHSWQKSHPPSWGKPWIPLSNEPEARSFMNYPYNVQGGQSAFFSDFEFRFSDNELLFMRHAPAKFVQMGNADWFDNHAFELASISPEPAFKLELRVHRKEPFEFLEPAALELKLTNISGSPRIVDQAILEKTSDMTVILKKQGKAARQWAPYATYCRQLRDRILAPGESMYAPLNVAAGLNGFDIAEPGNYIAQVALHLEKEDIVSNALPLRVAPPRDYDEEILAQDLFNEDVGRTLAMNGSRFFEKANDTLRKVVTELGSRRIAHHAHLALASPMTRDYKLLVLDKGKRDLTSAVKDEGKFITKAKSTSAQRELTKALTSNADSAAETLGHIDYERHVDGLCQLLAGAGETSKASECTSILHSTLTKRGVLKSVLDDIEERGTQYAKGKAPKKGVRPRRKPEKEIQL